MQCLIALSSRIGAGKSTIARALSETLNWPRVSFGEYIRNVAREQRLSDSRASLQELGESLVEADATGFTTAVLSTVNWQDGAIVDGIRHLSVLQALRNLVSPMRVLPVYVEVEESVRLKRLRARGMSEEEIKRADAHSTEVDVQGVLRQMAVIAVRGDGEVRNAIHAILQRVQEDNRE